MMKLIGKFTVHQNEIYLTFIITILIPIISKINKLELKIIDETNFQK